LDILETKEIKEKMEVMEKQTVQNFDPNVWKSTPNEYNQSSKEKMFCTFIDTNNVTLQIRNIIDRIDNLGSMMLLACNSNTPGYEYAITYNVSGKVDSLPYNTSIVCRRKETRTMYTIDALNRMKNSDGWSVDWEKFRNSIVVEKWGILHIYKTSVVRILKSKSYV
jgi:hypothetical protein